MLKDVKLYLLDMDGTIYLDDDLFDGTLDFLEYVKRIGGKYLFLTNNSSKSVDKYVEKLAKLDLYGAIIGKAYYTKAIDLKTAIEVAK